MAVQAGIVYFYLGIEGQISSVRSTRQRIDFGCQGVILAENAVEAAEDGRYPYQFLSTQASLTGHLLRIWKQSFNGGNMPGDHQLRMGSSHSFDGDPASSAQNSYGSALIQIYRNAQIILPGRLHFFHNHDLIHRKASD